MASEATAIRGKDWIFNAFWAACLSPANSSTRCALNIPVTALFKDGLPYKAVATDPNKGLVEKVSLDDDADFYGIGEKTSESTGKFDYAFRGDSLKCLRHLRNLLADFSFKHGYDLYQKKNFKNDQPFICKVIYTDNAIEDLTLKTLDVLLRNDSWRLQVLMIQGYVPALSSQIGNYSTDTTIKSKIDVGVEGLDQYSRAIAKYAEKAYMLGQNILVEQKKNRKAGGKGLIYEKESSNDTVKLKVTNMRCNFALDHTDKIVFIFCEYLTVEIESGRKEIEEQLKLEADSREAVAARSVSKELLSLLHHAQQRGLKMEEMFSHFDLSKDGFADTDMLIDGMARLGMGVTYPVAEAVLESIAGVGSSFFTGLDLERFLKTKAADLETFENLSSKSPTKINNGAAVSSESATLQSSSKSQISSKNKIGSRQPIKDKVGAVNSQLLPPLKSILSLHKDASDYKDLTASQSYVWENTLLDDSKPSAQDSIMELPLPEEDYSTLKDSSDAGSRVSLPKWAAKRSKRALNELKRSDTGRPTIAKKAAADDAKSDSKPKVIIGRSSKQKTAVHSLNLSGLADEIKSATAGDSSALQSKDELLHVDQGIIMTYRVIKGEGNAFEQRKTHETDDVLRYKSTLELRERNLKSSSATSRPMYDLLDEVVESETSATQTVFEKSFSLVVIPDIFMTLETLENSLTYLLKKYPNAQLILVGLPGMPNTTWPKTWILNSDLHSRSIAKLMQHLLLKGILNVDHTVHQPVIFVGFGAHCLCLTRFITLYLPLLQELHYQTKAVVVCNGLLRHSKKFKQLCKDLRQSLIDSNAFEINELITSLHLWDEYITVNGRESTLDKFWSTRRELKMDGVMAEEKAGLGYVGVLDQLKGIIISPDDFDGASLLLSELPVIVVQSTEDVFVDPKNALMFRDDRLPPDRIVVKDVADSLDANAVYVSWLKAGHEIVQEKNQFLLGLLSHLLQICGARPVETLDEFNEKANKVKETMQRFQKAEEEALDVLELASRRKKQMQAEREAAAAAEKEAARIREETEDKERKEIEAEVFKKEQEAAAAAAVADRERRALMTAEKNSSVSQEVFQEDAEKILNIQREAMLQKQVEEKIRRNKLLADRKRREEKLSRESAMAVLYEREQQLMDERKEQKELKIMEKEDARSRHAAAYYLECQIAEITSVLAKERSEDIARFRREEAVKRVEQQMALQRATRMEDRRRKAEAVVREIEGDQLTLSGMQAGGYDLPALTDAGIGTALNVQTAIDSSNRILRDLFECRQKLVDATKRQKLVEEKTLAFRKQLQSIKDEERRLRRAIRIIEVNPSIVADGNSESELETLRRSLALKEETVLESMTISRQRESQLSAANRVAQMLKVAAQEREALMAQRISELYQLENRLSDTLRKLKMEKEGLIMQKSKLNVQNLAVQKRIHMLNREILRVSEHTGVLIDTDVWVEGVTQRCRKNDLLKHLHRELDSSTQKAIAVKKEMDDIRHVLLAGSESISKLKRDIDKLTSSSKIFHKALNLFKKTGAQTVVKNLSDLQEQASITEQRQARERDIEKLVGRSKASEKGSATTALDKVRMTDSDLRTKEERQFVAIDLVINPEAYLHLSVAEAEQMQFDSDYLCPLSKVDIERIMKLPEQVNLALPFLSTADEINVHKLVNKFYREVDDNSLREKDFYGQDRAPAEGSQSLVGTVSLPSQWGGLLDGKDLQDAEGIHDILIRESLRDRLRALAEDEPSTIEEKMWMQMDKILSPHVYDREELKPLPTTLPQEEKTLNEKLSTSVIEQKRFPSKSILKQGKENTVVKQNEKTIVDSGKDGDIYEILRREYSDGTSIFDETSWLCPYNKDELLQLRVKQIESIRDENELLCLKLLQKYYVSDDESIVGLSRLREVAEISRKVAKVVTEVDTKAAGKLQELSQIKAQIGTDDFQEVITQNTAEKPAVSEMKNVTRIWGSWNVVHPASAGVQSQTSFFHAPSFNSHRNHPAAFAIRGGTEDGDDALSDISEEDSFSILSSGNTKNKAKSKIVNDSSSSLKGDIGVKLLTGSVASKTGSRMAATADTSSPYFIAESLSELTKVNLSKVRGKTFLLHSKDSEMLLDVKDATLQARQSRSHYFVLPQGENSKFIVDVTVSIVFQGDFGSKGYKLGRLAAGMFRLPTEGGSALPTPVGFAPYAMQSANLPGSLGRIVILHKPRDKPLKPGSKYQVVIGVASATRYSLEVTAKCAVDALPVLDEEIERAKVAQNRLPNCLKEMDAAQESIRLTERKLMLCNKMIQEAEAEADRCEKGMHSISRQLEQDDEDMQLLEDERRLMKRELNILEIEYAQWATNFSTRGIEKRDIQDGLKAMYSFQKDRIKEVGDLKSTLEKLRGELPSCVAVLRNLTEAVNVAAVLNTSLHGVAEDIGAAATGDFGGGVSLSTPAEEVRRRLRHGGFNALLLEEQQWCMLDQALNPSKYEWLREMEEKEIAERARAGKKEKDHRHNAAVEAFRLSKSEIKHIMDCPFAMLNRREVGIRKLLNKYHDDAEFMKRSTAAVALGFDHHRAERVRAKNTRFYSKEEIEWSSVDRILHPEIWAYYVNRDSNLNDRMAKAANDDSSVSLSKIVVGTRSEIKKEKERIAALKDRDEQKNIIAPQAPLEESNDIIDEKAMNTATAAEAAEKAKATIRAKKEAAIAAELLAKTVEESNDVQSTNDTHGGGIKLSSLVQAVTTAAKEVKKEDADVDDEDLPKVSPPYQCRLTKQAIIKIWRTQRQFLKTDEERKVLELLLKYNGAYDIYQAIIDQSNRRKQKMTQSGVHIQWSKIGKAISKDIDYRARQLLQEIDRATFTQNEVIFSDVLHASDQMYPTRVLRMHLEDELDNVLREQILERERAGKSNVDSGSDSDPEDDHDATGAVKQESDEDDDEDLDFDGELNAELSRQIKKRADRRARRKLKAKQKQLSMEEEVLNVRKKIARAKKKSGAELAEDILQAQLGVEGCLACRTRKCQWTGTVDVPVVTKRIHALDKELERVKLNKEAAVMESEVCLTAQQGGNKSFRRIDLLDELNTEKRELQRRLDLNFVDKEVHDAYASRQEYFESKYLHGYSILLWTNNARKALEARQRKLVAVAVAKDVVDDILDWMLEGWYFGERESHFQVLGYVPTVKKDGKVRAGQEQIGSVTAVVEKMKKRAEMRKKGILRDEARRGQQLEKAWEIEMQAQMRLTDIKVARDGNSHEHLLNETERTLRFGIFMLTLMYFRAMTYVRREQRSWNADDDEIGVKGKGGKAGSQMTAERMRMLDEERKVAARKKKLDNVLAKSYVGEARRLERERAERREAMLHLQAVIRRQRLELSSVVTIQRMYRGHIARKAAKRWFLKRAELKAMTHLLNAAAICVQRMYRGHLARSYAVIKRTEMAQFISLMRVQEAQADEEMYWQTHPWSRFKMKRREWFNKKLDEYRGGGTMGRSRLTAAEQAELEGKSIAEIKRKIDGFDVDDAIDGDGDDDEEGEEGGEEEDDA